MEQIFITNQNSCTLENRFKILLQSTRQFDILVGYFFSTGFNKIAPFLCSVEKTRILIGISTDSTIFTHLQQSKPEYRSTQEKRKDIEEYLEKYIPQEYELTSDTQEIENSALQFIEWIQNGKLEVRAYPTRNIHAKLYIMQFKDGDRDKGRVITGSSNLTEAGLISNHEFNVEIPHIQDYKFAAEQFNTLWKDSIDVNKQYVQVIKTHTWINDSITPYELYLKFLYEYFREDLQDHDVFSYAPKGFLQLKYQEQAVINAKRIVQEYGGVFISDVVGLGKTYIATMLAKTLGGKPLVIAPPALLDENNHGSWRQAFFQFHVDGTFTSTGKLEAQLESGIENFTTVIIDESHRFRSESTMNYDILTKICRGKKVILVSATPYNNKPSDLLSQIKLFQNSKNSTIPNIPNLEGFFRQLERYILNIDRKSNYTEYIQALQQNTREIRNRILKYLMVRRTRTEITKYFSDDIKKQGFNFPKSHPPQKLFYEFNETEDTVFTKTIELLSKKFKYARYTPFLFLKEKSSDFDQTKQINMRGFMKLLLVKRLESSFSAFKTSIDNFMQSYENFIKGCKNGYVYTSKKYNSKILSHIEEGNLDGIEKLIDEEKATKSPIQNFDDNYIMLLQEDLKILGEIKKEWNKIDRDPKLEALIQGLHTNSLLKKQGTNNNLTGHVILFTESKDTVNYLVTQLEDKIEGVIGYSGSSKKEVRQQVIENFDAKTEYPKNDYRVLICTDALSEGVNLHRSNVVINYDIPWNPTRVMQRVGRINRIDTKHTAIHTFNFFPTVQSNNLLGLEEAAKAKIHAFLTLLGGDAELLTEGEPVETHNIFEHINSINFLEGEEETESELKYYQIINTIKNDEPNIYTTISTLPKKARTGKIHKTHTGLLSYFKKGTLHKFILNNHKTRAQEIDFMQAATLLESDNNTTQVTLPDNFYDLLENNKTQFTVINADEQISSSIIRPYNNITYILQAIKSAKDNTLEFEDTKEIDLEYLNTVQQALEESRITKKISKKIKETLEKLGKDFNIPQKVFAVLQTYIPHDSPLLKKHISDTVGSQKKDTEVILSMYLTKE